MSIALKQGVNLHVIPTDKYKTIRVMIRFAAPLLAETISKRTLLSSLLETNSQAYPTQTKLSEKLADLYGASFGINVNKKGDSHYMSVILNVVNDKFLPNDETVLPEAIAFLNEIIFHPNATDSQFDQATFTREQENLNEYITSIYDDKQSYAALALQALYFGQADQQKVPSFGTVEGVSAETAETIKAYYDTMLQTDDIDIIVIGDVEEEAISQLFQAWSFKDRPAYEQPFYKQALVPEVLTKIDVQPVIQSKLNLAYQTDIYYHKDAYFALQVFNGLFGGFPHSKLFMNVREKESMAYYASSSIDTFRGLLTVQTGIDGANKERVLTLVEEQLASLIAGDIESDALGQTKEMLKNQYLLSLDNPSAVTEAAYIDSKFPHSQMTDDQWLAAVEAVSLVDVQHVAAKLKLQAVYFMEGGQA
ncbi:EF-P 5-aminopentanol modification-associated protein YfmF [uncultured Vagococcus sp.]|uniref:EF-P 5-aminopentanol modification-associated protein YfmF n=1 Tax=uncultured Vagococcus sp. TaxID=189676 RepID=UPI0028D4F6CF|nr:pitrilysin family protein [uncultured Vagococcus sp.]